MLSLIVAYGDQREMGLNGTMPWSIPGDLKHVKAVTLGKKLLMGRRTFDSLPGLLPKRIHIIVTGNENFVKDHPRVQIVHDLEAILKECAESEEEVVVFGGSVIYKAALPYVKKMYITRVHGTFEADTWFPEWDMSEWEETARSEMMCENGIEYEWIDYERKEDRA